MNFNQKLKDKTEKSYAISSFDEGLRFLALEKTHENWVNFCNLFYTFHSINTGIPKMYIEMYKPDDEVLLRKTTTIKEPYYYQSIKMKDGTTKVIKHRV